MGKFQKEFKNDRQGVMITTLIKGEVPKSNLFVSQQPTLCGYPQLPMSSEGEFLVFATKSGSEFKLTTRCYSYREENGIFDFKMNGSFVDVHRLMLPAFFKAKGRVPKVELVLSSYSRNKVVENILSIKNVDDRDLEIFHPSNRQAFTFFVTDPQGNVVTPRGNAKVDPAGGVLKIVTHGGFNFKIEPSSELYFPFLSGTAQFGYELKQKLQYKVHAIYRPYGGSYGAVYSEERSVPVY